MASDSDKVLGLVVEAIRAMPGLTAASRAYIDQAYEVLHPPAADKGGRKANSDE